MQKNGYKLLSKGEGTNVSTDWVIQQNPLLKNQVFRLF